MRPSTPPPPRPRPRRRSSADGPSRQCMDVHPPIERATRRFPDRESTPSPGEARPDRTPVSASIGHIRRLGAFGATVPSIPAGREHRGHARPVRLARRAVPVAISLVVDCHAFSHLTAARIHGLPLPMSLDDEQTVHVIRDAGDGAVRRRGVVGHRGLLRREVVDCARSASHEPGRYMGRPGRADPAWVWPWGSTTSSSSATPWRPSWARSMGCATRWRLGPLPAASSLWSRPSTRSVSVRSRRARPARDSSSCGPDSRSQTSTGRCTHPADVWLGRPDMRWTKQRASAGVPRPRVPRQRRAAGEG